MIPPLDKEIKIFEKNLSVVKMSSVWKIRESKVS